MNRTTKTTRIALTLAAALLAVATSSAWADEIVLRSSVEVEGTAVTLMNIAELEGRAAVELAGTRITTLRAPQQVVDVAEVRRILDEAGVHWGKISLRGATRVTITRKSAAAVEPTPAAAAEPAPETDAARTAAELLFNPGEAGEGTTGDVAVANPAGRVLSVEPAREPRTVRRLLAELILSQVTDDPGNVRIRFEPGAEAALAHSDAEFRIEIAPIARNPIGRVPVLVRRYQNERLVATDRIRVDVEVSRDVVVLRRNVTRDQTITSADVALERRWLDTLAQEPAGSVETVIGQRSVGMLREGAVLTMGDVAAPVLVERGQLVTVRVISGSLVLKTVARASADGSLGDEIAMQNERTRESFVARVTGVRQAVLALDGAESDRALEQARGGVR